MVVQVRIDCILSSLVLWGPGFPKPGTRTDGAARHWHWLWTYFVWYGGVWMQALRVGISRVKGCMEELLFGVVVLAL